jgi:hypothetical protein
MEFTRWEGDPENLHGAQRIFVLRTFSLAFGKLSPENTASRNAGHDAPMSKTGPKIELEAVFRA